MIFVIDGKWTYCGVFRPLNEEVLMQSNLESMSKTLWQLLSFLNSFDYVNILGHAFSHSSYMKSKRQT